MHQCSIITVTSRCLHVAGQGSAEHPYVFAVDEVKGQWSHGERGLVLGSRTPATVWVQFSHGAADRHDVA